LLTRRHPRQANKNLVYKFFKIKKMTTNEYQVCVKSLQGDEEYKIVNPSTLLKDIVSGNRAIILGKIYTDLNIALKDVGNPILIVLPETKTKESLIYLKRQNGTESIPLANLQKVEDLEKIIETKLSLSSTYFYLQFGWKILTSANYLTEYGITSGSTITLTISIPNAVRRVKSMWEIKECAICLEELQQFDRTNPCAINQTWECSHCFHAKCSNKLTICPLCNLLWIQDSLYKM